MNRRQVPSCYAKVIYVVYDGKPVICPNSIMETLSVITGKKRLDSSVYSFPVPTRPLKAPTPRCGYIYRGAGHISPRLCVSSHSVSTLDQHTTTARAMASSLVPRLPVAVLLLLVACSSTAAATSYTVGDGSGWTSGVDYTAWAASKDFKVGDNLGTYVCIHVVTHCAFAIIGSRACLTYRTGPSVQLREGAAHGGGGERGRVHGVHGRQPAGLRVRQQRRDHRGPQGARHPLLRV
jgi:hypothetical protein